MADDSDSGDSGDEYACGPETSVVQMSRGLSQAWTADPTFRIQVLNVLFQFREVTMNAVELQDHNGQRVFRVDA
jgi:hypothetical protein